MWDTYTQWKWMACTTELTILYPKEQVTLCFVSNTLRNSGSSLSAITRHCTVFVALQYIFTLGRSQNEVRMEFVSAAQCKGDHHHHHAAFRSELQGTVLIVFVDCL